MKTNSDNIRVVCRFRPLNKAEKESSAAIDMKIKSNKTVFLREERLNTRATEHNFNFDYVFSTKTE